MNFVNQENQENGHTNDDNNLQFLHTLGKRSKEELKIRHKT
jgi:hypothetical protein